MENILLPMIVAAFVAASASLLGSFAILKRMALVGDALSHVALPGMALALLFQFNPFIGAIAFLFVTVVGIWIIEYRSSLSLDTIVGVFFTASLAAGALVMPEHDLIEALFGNITDLTVAESVFSITLSVLLIVLILSIYKKLTLNMVSEEMAQSIGIRNKRLEFIYLLAFALAVALGIRFVGALLMGSLVIIPAASAKNIARSLRSFMTGSVVFGVAAASIGIYISRLYAMTPGPIFIMISSGIFITTLIIRQLRKPLSGRAS
ncbi:MAG: metal ABC transporter permease [Deltaproteobacteria bacterium]|nr:metal ABC transporter permease [Deltaproteobacteria bacterium]